MLEPLEPLKTLRITVFVVGVSVPSRSLLKTLGVVSAVELTVSVKVSSWAMRVLVVGVVVVGVFVVEVLVVGVFVVRVFVVGVFVVGVFVVGVFVVGVFVVGVFVVGVVVVGVVVVGVVLVVGVIVFAKRTTVAVAAAQGAFPLSGQS